MTEWPAAVDRRYHDAVIFDLDGLVAGTASGGVRALDSTVPLRRRLREVGAAPGGLLVRPELRGGFARRRHAKLRSQTSGSIAVVVDDSPGNDAVLESGFREARLRKAPILAMGVWRWGFGEIPYRQLNHRLGRWVAQYPDVHVLPAAVRHGAAEFLTSTQEPVQLAVVGSSDASKVARMVGPITPHFGHAGRSVLVVRDEYETNPG